MLGYVLLYCMRHSPASARCRIQFRLNDFIRPIPAPYLTERDKLRPFTGAFVSPNQVELLRNMYELFQAHPVV